MSTTMTLSELRTAVRQRADMVNSTFVSDTELNSYINQSYFELYDLLVTTYETWYMAPPLQIQTVGNQQLYDLPDGTLYSSAPALYKLLGVDIGVAGSNNAWVTLKRFEFISRNRFVYPQLTSTYLGVFNLRYDVVGDKLMFIPTPSAGQYIQLWYIPRMTTLSADSDTADGISGWTEYIICDGAIKCGQKEETDVSILMAQKQGLIDRIQAAAQNRDAGIPAAISDLRSFSERWGVYGPPNGDGGYGGY